MINVIIFILLMLVIGEIFARYDAKLIKSAKQSISKGGYQTRSLVKGMLIFCISVWLVGATTKLDWTVLAYILVTIGGLLIMDTYFILRLNNLRGLKPYYLGKGKYDIRIKKYFDSYDFMMLKIGGSILVITLLFITY